MGICLKLWGLVFELWYKDRKAFGYDVCYTMMTRLDFKQDEN